MMTCEVCENEYDKPLQVILNGETHVFDCFECAIHALAPICSHCGCKIIGHGVEADGVFFCCARCASREGVMAMRDREY
jgi:Rieske Fe-S protein